MPCDLIIYGGLGDLSRRKLIISLYRLENGHFLESDTRIIAVDRLEESNASFIKIAYKSLQEFLGAPIDEQIWTKFSARLSYQQMDLTRPEEYKVFNEITDSSKRVMVNYFAVAPFLFQHICQGLNHSGVLNNASRMVMEKPIGHGLSSSKEINNVVASVFNDGQVYRIDHYLQST
ncbi:hypothetical protein BMR04_03830 [Methylococcaceae bacterium HT3]|nr:hypothetical protein BMR04_03830 [Methylococcaceae bacterium HT3]